MGLKITACMCSWNKFWTKDIKRRKNPTATFEEPRAKAGYCPCPLHTTPTKGWANHLSHPSRWTPGHTPTLTPYNEQATPPSTQEVSKETCYLFLLPPAAAGAPIKPCLNFLYGLLSISISWGRPRTLVCIYMTYYSSG